MKPARFQFLLSDNFFRTALIQLRDDCVHGIWWMHQSFVVPAPMGPWNRGGGEVFNFSVFKALLNSLYCVDKFMVKSLLLKSPFISGPVFISRKCLLSVAKISLYRLNGKISSLLDTAKFKAKVSLTMSTVMSLGTMSLVYDSLKFTSSDTQIWWNFLLKKCE